MSDLSGFMTDRLIPQAQPHVIYAQIIAYLIRCHFPTAYIIIEQNNHLQMVRIHILVAGLVYNFYQLMEIGSTMGVFLLDYAGQEAAKIIHEFKEKLKEREDVGRNILQNLRSDDSNYT